MTSYKTTSVPIARSQEQIRKILQANGVRGVQFSEDFESHEVLLRFAKEVEGTVRTVRVALRIPDAPERKRTHRGSHWVHGRLVPYPSQDDRQEQMARATYRALHYWLKSQFEAVDFGLLRFEDIFLSHFEWIIGGKQVTTSHMLEPYLRRPALNAPEVGEIVGEVSDAG